MRKELVIWSAFLGATACGGTGEEAEPTVSRSGAQYDVLTHMDLGGGHNLEIREYAPGEVAIIENGTLEHAESRILPHLDLDVLSLEDVYEVVHGVRATGSTAQVLRDAETRAEARVQTPAEVAPTSPPPDWEIAADHATTATGIASSSQALSGQPCSADIYGDAWGASMFETYFCQRLTHRYASSVLHCVTNFGTYDSDYIHYPRWLDYFIYAADYNNDASTQIWKWVRIAPLLNLWDWDLTHWDTIPAATWRHYAWKGDAWRHITARGLGPNRCRIHASLHRER